MTHEIRNEMGLTVTMRADSKLLKPHGRKLDKNHQKIDKCCFTPGWFKDEVYLIAG